MDNYRNKTRKVQIGDVCIGGGEKIAIQSMTNTKTEDVEACVAQILRLEKQDVISFVWQCQRWKRQKVSARLKADPYSTGGGYTF